MSILIMKSMVGRVFCAGYYFMRMLHSPPLLSDVVQPLHHHQLSAAPLELKACLLQGVGVWKTNGE